MRLEKFDQARRAFNLTLKTAPPDSPAAKEAQKALANIRHYLAALENE